MGFYHSKEFKPIKLISVSKHGVYKADTDVSASAKADAKVVVTPPKKRGRPAKAKTTTEEKVETKAEESAKKSKIIQFPTKKPEIEKAVTEGNATYKECEEKLNKEREEFKDGDSKYVIEGLLELCKVDQDFRNNVMRENRSYKGSFEYFSNAARNGYAIKYGNCSYLDNDMALGLAIDYFNSKDEPKPEPKKSTAKKTETKTATKDDKPETKKRPTAKKPTKVVVNLKGAKK